MGFYGSNDPTNNFKALKEGPKEAEQEECNVAAEKHHISI